MSDVIKTNEQMQHLAFLQGLANAQLPQIVFNSYSHNHTASEFTSVLSFGSRPLLTLIMAPVVAKTFAISLLKMVEQYEAGTGVEVETIDVLTARITSFSETHE